MFDELKEFVFDDFVVFANEILGTKHHDVPPLPPPIAIRKTLAPSIDLEELFFVAFYPDLFF